MQISCEVDARELPRHGVRSAKLVVVQDLDLFDASKTTSDSEVGADSLEVLRSC